MKPEGTTTTVLDVDVDERIDWKRQRERFRRAIEEIGEMNQHLDTDEVMRIVTEEVEAGRHQHYGRARHDAEARR